MLLLTHIEMLWFMQLAPQNQGQDHIGWGLQNILKKEEEILRYMVKLLKVGKNLKEMLIMKLFW